MAAEATQTWLAASLRRPFTDFLSWKGKVALDSRSGQEPAEPRAASCYNLTCPGYSPARSRMTWSSRGSSEKCGILLAHSTRVKSCLSAA